MAKKNLGKSQQRMKTWYDKKSKKRCFKVGDRVLALLPILQQPLQARYCGPYLIIRKVNDVDYVINTPDRRKSQRLCHINMLKEYHDRTTSSSDAAAQPVAVATCLVRTSRDKEVDEDIFDSTMVLKNSDVLRNLKGKLHHLSPPEQDEMTQLILQFTELFPDVPGRAECVFHDVDIGNTTPIKQHPYRVNPNKLKFLNEEVDYMLRHGIIERSQSEWSSPCILVPKKDGTYRFCTDFRKLNLVTKADSYPIPRVEDCIDRIGCAKYISKLDLLKGYWQVPLTPRAKEISAFVTPRGFYQYRVMPFGMKNAPATFQRMINKITANFEGCEAYIDDVIVFGNTWEQHLERVRELFRRLRTAKLTVNLIKSDFGHAHVIYLGHVVGQGQVKPVMAKVEAIINYPVPHSKKEVMRFLGMSGYYRKFCKNFSNVCEPLTRLLRKDKEFMWNLECQSAFDRIKSLLVSVPVLMMPDFKQHFLLAVDASDYGAGAVLLQEDKKGIEHPISYFSHKFDKHQRNYSTSEKETLALVLALQHFDFYLSAATFPIQIYTDHNPLVFLSRMKNKNQRLLRWSLALQAYDLKITHIRGKDNIVADALSRG